MPKTQNDLSISGKPLLATKLLPSLPPGLYVFCHCPRSTALARPINFRLFSLPDFRDFLLLLFRVAVLDDDDGLPIVAAAVVDVVVAVS